MDDSKIVELYLSRNESAISQTAQKYGLLQRRNVKMIHILKLGIVFLPMSHEPICLRFSEKLRVILLLMNATRIPARRDMRFIVN